MLLLHSSETVGLTVSAAGAVPMQTGAACLLQSICIVRQGSLLRAGWQHLRDRQFTLRAMMQCKCCMERAHSLCMPCHLMPALEPMQQLLAMACPHSVLPSSQTQQGTAGQGGPKHGHKLASPILSMLARVC